MKLKVFKIILKLFVFSDLGHLNVLIRAVIAISKQPALIPSTKFITIFLDDHLKTLCTNNTFLTPCGISESTIKPVYNDHLWDPRKVAVVQRVVSSINLSITFVCWDLGWLLLAGSCCSEVVVSTGLTVLLNKGKLFASFFSANLQYSGSCLMRSLLE